MKNHEPESRLNKNGDHQVCALARCLGVILAIASLSVTGCETTKASSAQLARVAKDWCLTVRASQVIPVYPLTEDLQPGDVFLVQTPIEDQIRIYEQKGFLPLENLVVRCQLNGYAAFYQDSFGTQGKTNTPHHWQFPDDLTKTNGWSDAPRAGFPSYTFSVKRGAGMSLAVPVQGVPVALSLMGAGQAHGNVELADAYTYGLDMQAMQQQVEAWAGKTTSVDFLAQFAPSDNQTNYLRVVDRVYLTGRVNVSVISDEAYGATASGGASKPLDLLALQSGDASSNYVAVLQALSKNIDTALPGGTLKLAGASSRSVTMIETFPRPLVVGYIAFDLPILSDGELGPPVRTHARLTKSSIIPAATFGQDENTAKIRAWLKADPSHKQKLKDWLEQHSLKDIGIGDILNQGKYSKTRQAIVKGLVNKEVSP
jgi:hypothetical protein